MWHTRKGESNNAKREPLETNHSKREISKKAGYISKSYKLKKDVADRFAAACEKAGVSQAAKITELMEKFIAET